LLSSFIIGIIIDYLDVCYKLGNYLLGGDGSLLQA